MGLLKFAGRVCLSGIFIVAGYGAYSNPGGRPKTIARVGLPESEELVKLNGATMVGAGITLGLGIFPKLSALTLTGALLPTTVAGHPFWLEKDEKTMTAQRIQFLKNLGLIGGLLFVLADRKQQPVE